MADENVINELVENFMNEHDKDGNGVIDRNEAKTLFQSINELRGITEKFTEA